MQNYCLGLNNHSDLRCYYYSFSYTGTLIGLVKNIKRSPNS